MPSFNERWENVISKCGIDLTKPINYLKMADVTKYAGKETRLMTSIATEDRLPNIFKTRGLFLLPLSTKELVILKGKGYHPLEAITSPVQIHKTSNPFPVSLLETRGEAGFLNYAFFSGLVGKFTDRTRLRPSLQAKLRVFFDFKVDGLPKTFEVRGAQSEVDNSYEDDARFYITEAKYRTPNSFHIKQIYYPYKHFLPQMKKQSKDVGALFFVYEPSPEDDPLKGEYRFWEYRFKDPEDYEQIELVKSARYSIVYSKVKKDPLDEYSEIKPQKTMRAIQANDVFKLMDVPFAAIDGIDDAQKMSIHFGFDVRQSAYYVDGMRTLGFITTRGSKYVLTGTGEDYIKLPVEERTRFFLRKLVEYPPVSEIINRILVGEVIGKREMNGIAKKYDPNISGTTVWRRSQCYRTWFKFIADKLGYCKVEDGKISRINPRDSLDGFR